MKFKEEKNKKILAYILVQLIMLLYSFSGVCTKMAANSTLFSANFFIFLFAALTIMGVYAFLWQKVLKVLPLTYAFSSKAITVVWGILWGFLIFDEKITVWKIAGGFLVISGVVLFFFSERGHNGER